VSKTWGHKNFLKTLEGNILSISRDRFKFWHDIGDIADIIARAEFCVNRLRSFESVKPSILALSTSLAGRPCNNRATLWLLPAALRAAQSAGV